MARGGSDNKVQYVLIGIGVELGADFLQLAVQLLLGRPRQIAEEDMFQEMGNPMFRHGFIQNSRFDRQRQADAVQMGLRVAVHADPVFRRKLLFDVHRLPVPLIEYGLSSG